MRIQRLNRQRRGERGFALPVITFIAIMLLASMVFIMRRGISNQETEAKIQLRADYRQREDALVRALLAIVPNKAIGCMQEHSKTNHQNYLWDTIFTEAIDYSNGGQQLSAAAKTSLGLTSAVSSNAGDQVLTQEQLVVPLVSGHNADTILAGNTRNASILSGETIASKLPPMLGGANNVLVADLKYPIISRSKILTQNDATGEYQLEASKYPLYNLVKFPNVRFGFASPGDHVVGKRNWWAFAVEYGNGTGLGTIKKNYVLSIYELPNQLPISASATTTVGAFENGNAWGAGVKVSGSVFADRLSSEGAFNFDRLLGREGVALGGSTRVGGESIAGNFDDLGVREALAKKRESHILPVAVSSNSGRIAFVSLKRGDAFYTEAASAAVNTISDTTWDDYTRGPNQCAMKVYITKMKDFNTQEALEIEVNYLKPNGSSQVKKLKRYTTKQSPKPNDYWPEEKPGWESEGGSLIPFQTEQKSGGTRVALSFYPERLEAWLNNLGGGGSSVTINNSIYITSKPTADPITIRVPSSPSIPEDPAVILRGSANLSTYTKGLAIVSNLRCYVAGDVNQVSITPPSDAGLPIGELYYPPFAIFTPEYRIGTGGSPTAVNFHGQVGSVGSSDGAFRPLDFKSGEAVLNANQISADLTSLQSPAELPPIFNMNWLLTVEEIH